MAATGTATRPTEEKMAMVIRLIDTMKAAALFAVRRPKEAAIILLTALLAITFWRLKRERYHAQELAAKLEVLPSDTKQIITISKDHIITKWRDGPTKIEYRDRYLPPEGKVDVITKLDAPDRPPEVMIQDRGFTRRLGGGVVYAGEFLPLVDLKVGFWKHYSATVGVTPRFGGLGVSRHIDDLTPFGNLEILGMGGVDWSGDLRLGMGLRSNF